jgi:hypothetical protein
MISNERAILTPQPFKVLKARFECQIRLDAMEDIQQFWQWLARRVQRPQDNLDPNRRESCPQVRSGL